MFIYIYQKLTGIAVEEKVGKIWRAIIVAGWIHRWHEVVVDVVVASKYQNGYGFS